MRVAPMIQLSAEEEQKLRRLARSNTTSVRLARRARIVLLASAGLDNQAIADQINIGRVQVGRWRERYAQGGLAAIEHDLPRGGRPPKVDAAEIVRCTTQTLPVAANQWSTRTGSTTFGRSGPIPPLPGSTASSWWVMNLLILLRIFLPFVQRGGAVVRMSLVRVVERLVRYQLAHNTRRRGYLYQMATY